MHTNDHDSHSIKYCLFTTEFTAPYCCDQAARHTSDVIYGHDRGDGFGIGYLGVLSAVCQLDLFPTHFNIYSIQEVGCRNDGPHDALVIASGWVSMYCRCSVGPSYRTTRMRLRMSS